MSTVEKHLNETIFQKKELRPVIALVLAGLLGVLFYVLLRDQAFRWAGLQLSDTRKVALQRSEEFLTKQGYNITPLERAVRFWTLESPSIYLEKELGTAKTNELLRSDFLPVWGWSARFFQPLEKEEYLVWWSPRGRFIGFHHAILEEKKLPNLSSKKALKEASNFLSKHFPDEFKTYTLVEESTSTKANRRNHIFRWKRNNAPAETRIYLQVTVSGNEITSAGQQIEIPESFHRSESEIASRRDLLIQAMSHLDLLLSLATYLFLFLAWSRRWLRWKPALLLVGTLFVLHLVDTLNILPLHWYNYDTTNTPSTFWGMTIGYSTLSLLALTAWQTFPFASADAMGRLHEQGAYSLGEITSRTFFRSRPFLISTLAGFGAAGVQLGFVVLFYVVGRKVFGFYNPLDFPYSDLLSTSVPWIQPLLTGLEPALKEEAIYRLFAIPLVLLLTKKKWIAVLLPAVLWGFLHSAYYVDPIYARGIELTFVGIFLGFVFLRYGIWATIVSHYTYNATVSSSLLLSSNNLYFQIASGVVIGIVVLPFLFVLVRTMLGLQPEPLFFKHLVWTKETTPTQYQREERRQSKPNPALHLRVPGIIALLAGTATLVISVTINWEWPEMDLGRDAAIATARSKLSILGHSVDQSKVSTTFKSSIRPTIITKFIRERLSEDQAEQFLRHYQPRVPEWRVQFVTPGKARKCRVTLRSSSKTHAFGCRSPEDSQGITLSSEASLKLAANYLIREKKLDPAKLEYSGPRERDRLHRTDVTHWWIDPSVKVDDLRRYINVTISDGKVSSINSYLEPPESFIRAQERTTTWDIIRKVFMFISFGGIAFLFFRSLFDRAVLGRWRDPLPIWLGIFVAVLSIVSWLNAIPSFWSEYNSATAVNTYLAEKVLTLLGRSALAGFDTYIITLLFLYLTPQVFQSAPTREDFKQFLNTWPWRWRGARGTFLWAVAVLTLQAFLACILKFFAGTASPYSLGAAFAPFSTFFPASTVLLDDLPSIFQTFGAISIVFAAGKKYLPKWVSIILLVLLLISFIDIETTEIWESVRSILFWITFWWVSLRVIKFHLPFYFWYGLLSSVLPLLPWLVYGTGSFYQQALLAWSGTLILVIAVFAKRRGKSQNINGEGQILERPLA